MTDRNDLRPLQTVARRDRLGDQPVPVMQDSLRNAVDAGLDQLRNLARDQILIADGRPPP